MVRKSEKDLTAEPARLALGKARCRVQRTNLPSRSEQALAFAPPAINFDADIVKGNAIINARYFLPLNAHRLLSLYLSLLSRRDDSFPLMKISMGQIAETFPGLSTSKSVYADVSKALEHLFAAEIHIKQGDDWLRFRWAPTCGRQGGDIYLRLNDDLRPYLSGLVRQFTHYRLRFVLSLRSPYHFRFYELFKSYQYLGRCKIYQHVAKEWLQVPAGRYTNSGHFKDKILDPSIRAINEGTDILVSIISPIKESRKVIGWILAIKPKSREQLSFTATAAPIVERLVSDGFSADEARSLACDYAEEYLLEKIEYAERGFESGKVQSLTGFLRDAIHRDYRFSSMRHGAGSQKPANRTRRRREGAARDEYERQLRVARESAPYSIRLRKAQTRLDECDEGELATLYRCFADYVMKLGGLIVREYSEKGRESTLVAPVFRTYICDYFKIPETTMDEVQAFIGKVTPEETVSVDA